MDTRRAASMFNSAIEAFAVVSAWELGLLDELRSAERVDLPVFAGDRNLHLQSLEAIADALVSAGVAVEQARHVLGAGQFFDEFFATKGFFAWLLGGCGELLRTGGRLAAQEDRSAAFASRDGAAIAAGCSDFGASFIDPVVRRAFDRLPWHRIADLGCGSGQRLIQHVSARPGSTGVGIDVSPSVVAYAREQVTAVGLEDQIEIVLADVHDLRPMEALEGVDLACSFLMGHDFWPRARCVDLLLALPTVFPNLRHFVLCDTYRSGVVPSEDIPLLTLGFEHVHGLLGQYLPTLEEWRDVFGDGSWTIEAEHDLTLPPFTKIFQLVRG